MRKIIFCSIVLGSIYLFTASDASAQCTNFVGRAREKVCTTKQSYDACLTDVKQGTIDFCALSGDANAQVRRGTPGEIEATLKSKGCKKLKGSVYECESSPLMCNSYKNFFLLMQTQPAPIAACQLAASGTDAGDLYLYAVGMDDRLWTIKKTKGTWGGSKQLGPFVNGGPDACSPNPGKVIVMYRDKNNAIHAGFFNYATNKYGWANFLSKAGSDPTTVCQSGDRVTMFVRGHNNAELYGSFAENGVWPLMQVPGGNGLAIEDVAGKAGQKKEVGFWDKLVGAGEEFTSADTMLAAYPFAGAMKGSPDGVAFGGDNRAVFVRGTDDSIWWRMTSDNKTWSAWDSLSGGVKMSSDPSAVSRKPGEILLFARGQDNKLWVRAYNNGSWGPWVPWGGVMAGSPDATSWGGNRVDVFYRNPDGSISHVWRDDTDPLIKQPKTEKVPYMGIKNDLTAVGVKW